MWAVDGVFRGVEKGAWAVLHISFDPLSLEDDDRFGGLGVAMSGDDGAWGELAQQESGAVGGVVGKVSKLNPRIGAGFPHGCVGKADGWKHGTNLAYENPSDNPLLLGRMLK